ncbi:MAG: methyltransferase domain-containing protein, partial [Vicinamibacterales bacterium]
VVAMASVLTMGPTSSFRLKAEATSASGGWAQDARPRTHDETPREQWQKVDEIFAAMQVKPGAAVADIGAGNGFFTTRLASAVGPTGRVLAVDIGADALRRLRARVDTDGLKNVEVIEGAVDDPKLPPASLDAALIVNAYHEMTEHQAMLAHIKAALKPGGRLVIVEPIGQARREAARDVQTRNHEIAIDFVRDDARTAGFAQVSMIDPFTSRPHAGEPHEEWMLVLTPAAPVSSTPPARTDDAAQVFSAGNDAWKAPELRISVAEFKKRAAAGNVIVLDVRDPVSFRQGHLPGAVLMTPEELSTPEGAARLKGEKRLIVAYCS